jgi:5-formyltetrahydrofolate cyclo-ligase
MSGLDPVIHASQQKSAMRAEAIARRAALDPAAGHEMAEIALRHVAFPRTVAGFWPIQQEIDTRPLLHALHARGHIVLLPQTPHSGRPLVFRRWSPESEMIAERFGTSYPNGPEATPEFILVPLLAWDRSGGRLGYGGGFYDVTLASLPGVARAGVAYAALEVPAVPMEKHDIRLPAVITERELVRVTP